MSPQIFPEPSFNSPNAQNQEPTLKASQDWDAEYNFWSKIISEEVERLRFNGGFEPVRIDLYPANQGPIAFLGETQVGKLRFEAAARWGFDALGRKVLRLAILKAK